MPKLVITVEIGDDGTNYGHTIKGNQLESMTMIYLAEVEIRKVKNLIDGSLSSQETPNE